MGELINFVTSETDNNGIFFDFFFLVGGWGDLKCVCVCKRVFTRNLYSITPLTFTSLLTTVKFYQILILSGVWSVADKFKKRKSCNLFSLTFPIVNLLNPDLLIFSNLTFLAFQAHKYYYLYYHMIWSPSQGNYTHIQPLYASNKSNWTLTAALIFSAQNH